MKRIFLPILFFVIISGCRKYVKTNDDIYIKGWNEASGRYWVPVKADAATFQKIKTHENLIIGKDKNNVFVEEEKIDNCDPKTFKRIGHYYYTDEDSVYFFGFYSQLNNCEVKGADPKTFKLFKKYPWAYDSKHIIYGHTTLEINNFDDVEILSGSWAKTKDSIIYKGKILVNADVESFKIIDSYKGKDKFHTYEDGKIKD